MPSGDETSVTRSPYDVLDVPPDASVEQIRAAFRRLVLRYHPDRNAAPDAAARFHRVERAYETLRDPRPRAAVDVALAETRAAAARSRSAADADADWRTAATAARAEPVEQRHGDWPRRNNAPGASGTAGSRERRRDESAEVPRPRARSNASQADDAQNGATGLEEAVRYYEQFYASVGGAEPRAGGLDAQPWPWPSGRSLRRLAWVGGGMTLFGLMLGYLPSPLPWLILVVVGFLIWAIPRVRC
jgi:curved DNA-binding protein CbpA